MKAFIFSLLMGGLLASCVPTTPQARIAQEPGKFEALSPKFQQLVQQGQLARGMNADAVYLAWGSPSNVYHTTYKGRNAVRWDYERSQAVYRPGPFYAGHYYMARRGGSRGGGGAVRGGGSAGGSRGSGGGRQFHGDGGHRGDWHHGGGHHGGDWHHGHHGHHHYYGGYYGYPYLWGYPYGYYNYGYPYEYYGYGYSTSYVRYQVASVWFVGGRVTSWSYRQ